MVEGLDKLTVVKLKEQLKELGLPVAGRKAELVARLQEALEAEGDKTAEKVDEDAEEVNEEAKEVLDELEEEAEQAGDDMDAAAEAPAAEATQPPADPPAVEPVPGETTEDSDEVPEAAEPAPAPEVTAEPVAQETAEAASADDGDIAEGGAAEVAEVEVAAQGESAPTQEAAAGSTEVDSQVAQPAPASGSKEDTPADHKSASNNERHSPDPIPAVEEDGAEGGPAPVDVAMAPVEEPVSATPVREERLPAMQAAMLAPQPVAGEAENMEIEEDVDFEADDAEDVEPSAATPPPERDTKLRRDEQPDEPAEQTAKTTSRKSARGKRLVNDTAAEPDRKKGRHSEPTGADKEAELARSDSKSGRKREPIPLFKSREARERERKANGEAKSEPAPLAPSASLEKKPSIFDRIGPASADGAPVPARTNAPATRTKATRALLITGFIRPFTVPSVKNMLNTHGEVEKLWMPLIKDCAYVLFKSEQDAEAARQATHGLEWPVGSRTSLRPKFIAAEEADDVISSKGDKLASKRSGGLATTGSGAVATAAAAAAAQPIATEKAKAVKCEPAAAEKSKQKEDTKPSAKKEKVQEKEKVMSLDDLFKKTEALPHLYWLPLTEKQIAAKTAAVEAKSSKEKS